MALSAPERQICDRIAAGECELVELAAALIGFDTVTRDGAWSPRQERPLQQFLADRLAAAGAEIDLWEPGPEELCCPRQVPADLRFDDYPQLLARFGGRGPGRTLLLNGHIDVVSGEPRAAWTSDPSGPRCATGSCSAGAPAT